VSESRARNLTALGIFLLCAITLFIFHSNRFVATNDEGMILEPAQRMLGGARPYVDFFGYMSPGSYWIQWLVFRVLGVSLATGRVVIIFDFALQCALVFWLTARIASRRTATVGAILFAGFGMADPSALTATHRWDSGTLALAAVAVAMSESRWRWFWSGALIGAAAWCTPSVGAVGLAIVVYLAIEKRRDIVPFGAGAGAVCIAGVVALVGSGSLRAFIDQLAWLRTNYSAVNIMPYGAIIGGYRALFEGSTGAADVVVRSVLVACVALPAVLPILGVALVVRKREALLLVLATIAFVATVFPRADVAHLSFVVALPMVLACAGMARFRFAAPLAMAMILLACVFGANFFSTYRDTALVNGLRVPKKDATAISAMFAAVRPGSTLFVYPYMPIHYFVTQAKNPTRFSFLAPGMMTDREASIALGELEKDSPQHILYMHLSREEFLRVFPHATQLSWRFPALESWMEQNYEPDPQVNVWGYQLYRARPLVTSELNRK
jgi:hypothetical protein